MKDFMRVNVYNTANKPRFFGSPNNVILGVLGLFLAGVSSLSAQEKDSTDLKNKEGIGTEVVNVVKAYTPTISDANKIQQTPSLSDSITTATKEIDYTIFSVPVASTFTPSKGKATGLKRAPKEQLYNSYLALGVGNYNTALLDFYTSYDFSRDQRLDVMLTHHSSQGGIDQVELDDKFYNTALQAHYKMSDRYMNWGIKGGFQHQIYNWYGVPADLYASQELAAIDEKQSYYTVFIGGDIGFQDSYFSGGEVYYRRFWDAANSGENRAVLSPKFEFPMGNEWVNLDVMVDYVGGEFDRTYFNGETPIKYSNLMAGVSPSFQLSGDDYSVTLGASIVYNQDLENSDGDFFFYPNVQASYDVIDEFVTVYGGVDGQLKQNSYYDFAQENPYVSPTIFVRPTDQKYNGFVGVQGRFLPNVGYNLKGTYRSVSNAYFYRSNSYHIGMDSQIVNDQGYAYGNSFEVLYDDVSSISVFGEINVDINRNFSAGVNAEYMNYSMDDIYEPWNVPNFKSSAFASYFIGKWSAGVKAFYIGEREDFIDNPTWINPERYTLDGYFDLNANVGYDITDQWSAFVKANNITGGAYNRYVHYPVQDFQILAGVSYKFDL